MIAKTDSAALPPPLYPDYLRVFYHSSCPLYHV